MGKFWHDLRHGARLLGRSPGFTALAVMTLALGIGGSTAIFSVVYGVLLRPLPYPNAGKIARVYEVSRRGYHMAFSDPDFEDLRRQDNSFADLAEFNYDLEPVSGDVQPELARVATVSRGFFRTMGTKPFAGSGFPADQLHAGGAAVALVSYSFWKQALGGTADFAAKHLILENHLVSIVGVMPRGFAFPATSQIWLPREQYPVDPYRTGHNWPVIGRLKDGVSLDAARAQAKTIAERLKQKYGSHEDMVNAAIVPLAEEMVSNARPALLILLGAVGLLLLVACANVANLLLAQAAGRQRELAVRVALGASRGRLAGQFVAETLMLSLGGVALGLPVALWGVHALLALEPGRLPRPEQVGLHPAVIGFAGALAVGTAVGLGAFTALRAFRGELQESLKDSGRTQTGGASSHRARMVLMGAQVAVTLMLLIGAGLLARSFFRLLAVNPGFRTNHIITMNLPDVGLDVDPLNPKPGDQALIAGQVQKFEQLLARLRAIPGIENVGTVDALPFTGPSSEGGFLIMTGNESFANLAQLAKALDALQGDRSRIGEADYFVASGGYFRAMGIPLIRGRVFEQRDGPGAPEVAVISQSLAQSQWPGRDPIGKIINFGGIDADVSPITIVGVVGDVRDRGLAVKPRPTAYVDYRQRPLGIHDFTVVVETRRATNAIVPSMRAIERGLWPNVPAQFSTIEDSLSASLVDRKFNLILLGAFALMALLVALLGVYGVGSYLVSQRTKEIGIRMALGAESGAVVRTIAAQGLRVILAGAVAGAAAALALSRVLESLLYGVSAMDPLTFLAAVAFVVVAGLAACYVPARRAARVDPIAALREQ